MERMDQTKASKRAAEAVQPGQSAAEGSWSISSRPCSTEGPDSEEQLASMACFSMQYGDKILCLSIKPSTGWTADDLQQLSTLVQSRNRFVCMQLLTMAKEQYDKVEVARPTGNAAVLHTAQFMFLGTVALQDTGAVVAAALFYPRQCSKDGVEMPHMYVELLCCNSPGHGYGSVLLHHLEQYTAAGCEYISAGFFGNEPAAGNTCTTDSVALVSSTYTGSTMVAQTAAAVLPVLACGVESADPFTGCCAACSRYNDSSSSSISSTSLLPPTAAVAVTGYETICSLDVQQQKQQQLAVSLDTVTTVAPAEPSEASTGQLCLNKCCKHICGIKLLSVESAQAFYTHNGYGTPDVCKEMFKPLSAKAAARSASTNSVCSLTSVSSSSSHAMC